MVVSIRDTESYHGECQATKLPGMSILEGSPCKTLPSLLPSTVGNQHPEVGGSTRAELDVTERSAEVRALSSSGHMVHELSE